MRVGIIIALFVGIAVPLLCQFLGPLASPGPEFTQLYTVLSAVLMFPLAAHVAARTPLPEGATDRIHRSLCLTRSLWVAMVLGGSAIATMVVANELGPRCNLAKGIGLYWLTWTPPVVLACVLGAAASWFGLRRRWIAAALLALIGADVACVTLMQVAGLRVVDPLIGVPLFADAVLPVVDIPTAHVVQRIAVLAVTIALWYALQWVAGLREPNASREASSRLTREWGLQLGLVLAVAAVTAALSGALDGLQVTVSSKPQERWISQHFSLHFSPDSRIEPMARAVLREAEWQRARLVGEWELVAGRPIELALYEDRLDLSRSTGMSNAHVSDGTIQINANDVFRPLFRHELVHALCPSDAGITAHLRHNGIFEGVAEAYSEDFHLHPHNHRRVAARMEAGRLPPIGEVLSARGFLVRPLREAYDAAGSFAGFLMLEHGIDAYFDLRTDRDFERVYGIGQTGLEIRWRAFLERVPVGPGDVMAIRYIGSYDRSTYICQPCGKLGRRAALPLGDYWQYFWSGRFEKASEVARDEVGRGDEVNWTLLLAEAEREQGLHPEAAGRLRDRLGAGDLDTAETYAYLEGLRSCLMDAGAWDELAEVTDELVRLDPLQRRIYLDRVQWQWLDLDSPLREEVGEALAEKDENRRREALGRLQSDHPQDEVILRAVLFESTPNLRWWRTGEVTEAEARSVLEWLDRASDAPGVADAYGAWATKAADHVLRSGHGDLGEAICSSFGAQVTDPVNRLLAERCMHRVAWERANPEVGIRPLEAP